MKEALGESQRCSNEKTRRCLISAEREIRPYPRSGKPDATRGNVFGKKVLSRYFTNPETGEEEEYGLIGQKDWSVVLALTASGNVLVVRQFKQGVEKIVDELPAGTADWKGEDPEAVMRRELRQETGHEAGEMIHLGRHPIASRGSWTHFDCFLALGCKKVGEPNFDKKEPIEYREVEFGELVTLIAKGEINEPSAICAVFLSLPHLFSRGMLDPLGLQLMFVS